MPKTFIVKLEVPSGSRAQSMTVWLNTLLGPHRMKVLSVADEPSEPTQFRLIRLPSTMEDAGREFLVGTYPTQQEAEQARDRLATPYYPASCFKIIGDS